MAGPAITTLLSPNPASGNTTTDGTEQTLASSTSLSVGAIFQPIIDLTNMVDGDVVEVRTYNQANGSGSLVEESCLSFANTQTDKVPLLPASVAVTGEGYKVTIKRISGTDRAYQWSARNTLGT